MTALKVLLGIVVMAIVVLLNTVVVMWCERKWAGHMQSRLGPMRTGWHGVMQPFADALKMLGKEIVTPDGVDKVLFAVAPLLATIRNSGTIIPTARTISRDSWSNTMPPACR